MYAAPLQLGSVIFEAPPIFFSQAFTPAAYPSTICARLRARAGLRGEQLLDDLAVVQVGDERVDLEVGAGHRDLVVVRRRWGRGSATAGHAPVSTVSARVQIEVPAAAYPEPKPSEPKSLAVMCGMPCSVRVMVALYVGAAAAAPPVTEGTTTESSAGTKPERQGSGDEGSLRGHVQSTGHVASGLCGRLTGGRLAGGAGCATAKLSEGPVISSCSSAK